MTETQQRALRKEPAALMNDEDKAEVPQVVASYAAYLHARTRTTPVVTVTGDHAEVASTRGDKTLVLSFKRCGDSSSLTSAELHCGTQVTTYRSGELARAVSALMERPGPGQGRLSVKVRAGAAT